MALPECRARFARLPPNLIRVAKERNLPVILVGHVTKDGSIAGPRVLEHLVDVVCHFEGDRQTSLRFVRSLKNRFGPTDEVGCFEMTGEGIREVPDPKRPVLVATRAASFWNLRNRHHRGPSRTHRRGAGPRGQEFNPAAEARGQWRRCIESCHVASSARASSRHASRRHGCLCLNSRWA